MEECSFDDFECFFGQLSIVLMLWLSFVVVAVDFSVWSADRSASSDWGFTLNQIGLAASSN